MKLTPQRREEVSSATLTQTLWLVLAFSGLLLAASYASPPSWWSSRGAVNSSLGTNDYAAVNEGQLKQFTARAVDEMNVQLTNYGGAGSTLTNLVYGWHQDYLTNGYSGTTPKPSDFQAVNVGQLKYI